MYKFKSVLSSKLSLPIYKYIGAFTILITLFLLSSCSKKDDAKKDSDIPLHKVMEVSTQSTSLYTKFPVTIKGNHEVEVRSMVEGYIEEMYIDEGAIVEVNQPLFRIKAPQYEQELIAAQAAINIAQENLNTAQMEIEKLRPLVESEIISFYELKTAQNTANSRRALLKQAQTKLADAKMNLSYTIVKSPVQGVAGLFPFRVGSLVGPTTAIPLTIIASTANVHAYFSMNEKQLLEINRKLKGSTMIERLKNFPAVELILADGVRYTEKGYIETAGGLIDRETGSINMRATFSNKQGLISSGSSGVVLLPIHLENAILIPQSATYEIQDKKFVYVVSDSGIINTAEIKIKVADEGKYFVVEDGLKVGQLVVVEGISSIKTGTKIKVLKTDPVDLGGDL